MPNGVAAKVNVDPPLTVLNVMFEKSGDEATKSLAIAVVAPAAPETAMVQLIGLPAREVGVVEHDKLDAVVGVPYTTVCKNPLEI